MGVRGTLVPWPVPLPPAWGGLHTGKRNRGKQGRQAGTYYCNQTVFPNLTHSQEDKIKKQAMECSQKLTASHPVVEEMGGLRRQAGQATGLAFQKLTLLLSLPCFSLSMYLSISLLFLLLPLTCCSLSSSCLAALCSASSSLLPLFAYLYNQPDYCCSHYALCLWSVETGQALEEAIPSSSPGRMEQETSHLTSLRLSRVARTSKQATGWLYLMPPFPGHGYLRKEGQPSMAAWQLVAGSTGMAFDSTAWHYLYISPLQKCMGWC